jgi:hypothetical protein
MKIMNKIVKILRLRLARPDKAGGVIMVVSLLIITGAFLISSSIASLVMIAINISRTQGDSVRAYFAADSGLERALAFDAVEKIEERNCGTGYTDLCCDTVDDCLFFDQTPEGYEEVSGCLPCEEVNPQYMEEDDETKSYQLIYKGASSSKIYLKAIGDSNGVKRSIKLTIYRIAGCVPDCGDEGVPYQCGYNGCNGFCGQCNDGYLCDNTSHTCEPEE